MQTLRSFGAIGALALALGFSPDQAQAQTRTPAGSSIDNIAQVTYSLGATSATATSNTVSVTVAEILDVMVTLQSTPQVLVSSGATQQALVYLVTNNGNGPETFRLVMNSVLGSDHFDPIPASPAIYLDSNLDGILSAGDMPYVVGPNDPALNPEESALVFVLNDIPAGALDGNLGYSNLTADARTGTGLAGTTFAGQGVNGTDAVVGTSGALSVATGTYQVAQLSVNALKSQTVVDDWGGARPVPGSIINYTIVVSATGTGTATSAVFIDNIPANTTYVAGTLRLNSTALTDVGSDDAGEFSTVPNARVRVQLGSLSQASGSQTIQFAVEIK